MEKDRQLLVSKGRSLPISLFDLWNQIKNKEVNFRTDLFETEKMLATPLEMNKTALRQTLKILRSPKEIIESQSIFMTRDLSLRTEALINPIRSRRFEQRSGTEVTHLIYQEREKNGCRWCDKNSWHVSQSGGWADSFGEVVSDSGKVRAHANWARQGQQFLRQRHILQPATSALDRVIGEQRTLSRAHTFERLFTLLAPEVRVILATLPGPLITVFIRNMLVDRSGANPMIFLTHMNCENLRLLKM
ncbi:MAG: hypothetical protein OEY91_14410 [Nitrospirota bacterium]|nr:hypothetical protein [Nitrospirota bacterium]